MICGPVFHSLFILLISFVLCLLHIFVWFSYKILHIWLFSHAVTLLVFPSQLLVIKWCFIVFYKLKCVNQYRNDFTKVLRRSSEIKTSFGNFLELLKDMSYVEHWYFWPSGYGNMRISWFLQQTFILPICRGFFPNIVISDSSNTLIKWTSNYWFTAVFFQGFTWF